MEDKDKFLRAQFRNGDQVIDLVHNIQDKDALIGVFEHWLKHTKPEHITSRNLVHLINTIREAGMEKDWYAMTGEDYDQWLEIEKERGEENEQ